MTVPVPSEQYETRGNSATINTLYNKKTRLTIPDTGRPYAQRLLQNSTTVTDGLAFTKEQLYKTCQYPPTDNTN
jgi:hypothetical protein